MDCNELLHDFEWFETADYVFGDRVWLVVVIGYVLNIEGEDLGIEGEGFSLVLISCYLEDDASHFHPIIKFEMLIYSMSEGSIPCFDDKCIVCGIKGDIDNIINESSGVAII